ncbi:hypothetical protein [Microvirga brassicacearum]|uniref:Uncharacterized protein n=1 Tax=Microvirga brassicacearum TaxID=2580413 RepID=A0A5N3PHF3_9HYPH|nr:hypothetical protein [Microvirga brassicacearum]KAB0269150.1 hypothetical protein FEZ63_03310 [Microvirga brassicacearum]
MKRFIKDRADAVTSARQERLIVCQNGGGFPRSDTKTGESASGQTGHAHAGSLIEVEGICRMFGDYFGRGYPTRRIGGIRIADTAGDLIGTEVS